MSRNQGEREIRESVAEGEPMSREQMAGWLLQWITGGDIRGYAERVMRARAEKAGAEGKAETV